MKKYILILLLSFSLQGHSGEKINWEKIKVVKIFIPRGKVFVEQTGEKIFIPENMQLNEEKSLLVIQSRDKSFSLKSEFHFSLPKNVSLDIQGGKLDVDLEPAGNNITVNVAYGSVSIIGDSKNAIVHIGLGEYYQNGRIKNLVLQGGYIDGNIQYTPRGGTKNNATHIVHRKSKNATLKIN